MVAGGTIGASKETAPRRGAFRDARHPPSAGFSRNGIVRAAFKSYCGRCRRVIAPRSLIVFDPSIDKFVHRLCGQRFCIVPAAHYARTRPSKRRRPAVSASASAPAKRQRSATVHGLKPATLSTYTEEWDRYVNFAVRRGRDAVPGRDTQWDLILLYDFMLWRAETNKPTSLWRIFSILTHFGTVFGFLLANSRFDSDSLTYRRLKLIKKQLVIDHAAKHGTASLAPNRCTPLGKWAVELLFAAFGVISRLRFTALPRRDKHHLACCVLQHTQGMRFGHFIAKQYTVGDFCVDARDGSMTLVTDWHRYSGRAMYRLTFATFPVCSAQWYSLRDATGHVVDKVSAATVLTWHFDALRQHGETAVFAPVVGVPNSHADRLEWLQTSLLAALPASETAARKQVSDVTPHSFRPGLAGDLLHAGKRFDEIAAECRWHGTRNARMYAERAPLGAFVRSTKFKLIQLPAGSTRPSRGTSWS